MYRVLVVLAAGCGRIGFDPSAGDATPLHDEDHDGVPDEVDVCPHIPGPQVDTDGDGVGDDCDPEPTNPRQHRALFAAMTPGDQPFMVFADGIATQLADALHVDGNASTHLYLAGVTYQSVQITVGIDVAQVLGTGVQHQIAMAPTGDQSVPYDFGELNEGPGYSHAEITHFTGTGYTELSTQDLTAGMHAGPVQLQITLTTAGMFALDGGWPSDAYHLTAPVTWSGTTGYGMDFNNLVFDLDYIFFVSW